MPDLEYNYSMVDINALAKFYLDILNRQIIPINNTINNLNSIFLEKNYTENLLTKTQIENQFLTKNEAQQNFMPINKIFKHDDFMIKITPKLVNPDDYSNDHIIYYWKLLDNGTYEKINVNSIEEIVGNVYTTNVLSENSNYMNFYFYDINEKKYNIVYTNYMDQFIYNANWTSKGIDENTDGFLYYNSITYSFLALLQNAGTGGEFKDLAARLQNLEDKDKTLESRISNLKDKDETLESSISNLQNEDNDINQNIVNLNAIISNLSSEIEILKQQNKDLQSRIEELEK